MITFQNQNKFKITEIDQVERTISTLLIPNNLVQKFLDKKLEEHGNNTAVYLKKLLSRFRILTFAGMLPRPRKIKTEYQEENLNLKRISFRPANSDWIELGELSLAFGKSRCWLFTYLLQLDLDGVWETLSNFFTDESVPTTINQELKSSWTLHRYFKDFVRNYHVKV